MIESLKREDGTDFALLFDHSPKHLFHTCVRLTCYILDDLSVDFDKGGTALVDIRFEDGNLFFSIDSIAKSGTDLPLPCMVDLAAVYVAAAHDALSQQFGAGLPAVRNEVD